MRSEAWELSPAVRYTALSLICIQCGGTFIAQEQDDVLEMVKKQKVSEQTLLQKLTDYVERIDTDLVSTSRCGSQNGSLHWTTRCDVDCKMHASFANSPALCDRHWSTKCSKDCLEQRGTACT